MVLLRLLLLQQQGPHLHLQRLQNPAWVSQMQTWGLLQLHQSLLLLRLCWHAACVRPEVWRRPPCAAAAVPRACLLPPLHLG